MNTLPTVTQFAKSHGRSRAYIHDLIRKMKLCRKNKFGFYELSRGDVSKLEKRLKMDYRYLRNRPPSRTIVANVKDARERGYSKLAISKQMRLSLSIINAILEGRQVMKKDSPTLGLTKKETQVFDNPSDITTPIVTD